MSTELDGGWPAPWRAQRRGRDIQTHTVAIVGYGAAGKHLHQLFPRAVIYDEPLGIGVRKAVNQCEFAFVAVPTNSRVDGACDTAIVEEVVGWLQTAVIVLRSTVAVGTTDRLKAATGKRLVFQPEFWGESPGHSFKDGRMPWAILGGDRRDTRAVANLYTRTFGAELAIQQTNCATAELTKYMDTCFLALKVTFCNEFYDLARLFGVDYDELRELWVQDPRIGRSHSAVLPDQRGYGGKCFPKDTTALVTSASLAGYVPRLLVAMQEANASFRRAGRPASVPLGPSPNGHPARHGFVAELDVIAPGGGSC